MIDRRKFLGGFLATLVAPAIIRMPGLLMPIRQILHSHQGVTLRTSRGLITEIIITNAGAGYVTQPRFTITGGDPRGHLYG